MKWSIEWANGGCIGGSAGSILHSNTTGFNYMMIEAADISLTCSWKENEQWIPFGLLRSQNLSPSGTWSSVNPNNPFMIGPHVGCTIQYNSLWEDVDGTVYWGFWSSNIEDGRVRCKSWYLFQLNWGARSKLPMRAPIPQCR